MSDPLDRAVDARLDAYRPDTIPPFEAIESRKRSRDRRRMAAGAGALSIVALAAAGVVVPALSGGGDRLTPAHPPEAVSVTRFAVQYNDGSAVAGRSDGADAALARCLELPGARDRAGAKLSDPIVWVVTVEGTDAQTSAVRDCLTSLDDAKVQIIPDVDVEAENVLFRVTYADGAQYDPATDDPALARCAAMPGARAGVTLPMSTPIRSVVVSGTTAEVAAVERCLRALPNTRVEREEVASSAPDVAAVVERCIGSTTNIVPTDTYVGLTENELHMMRGPARNVRVVARDGECTGRDRALVDGRINLIIDDGRIVWVGVERLRYIADAVKGCAPNDAPAVVGRLQQDVPGGTLELTGPNGEALGETPVPPQGEGFVLRIRSMSTEPLEGSGKLRLRNQEGLVLEEREVLLQQTGSFSLCG